MDGVREGLLQRASDLGFELVGIAAPSPSEHTAHLRRWIAAMYHGEMGYLAREDALQRRADPSRTMANVASIIVVAHEYHQEDADGIPEDPALGVVARYARGRDYHRVVKGKLKKLLSWLDANMDGGARGRVYVDTGPVLERELARRAGLGWFGKNTMLIHPGRGSYFFLGVLFVDVALPVDRPFPEDRCGTCRQCLDACPTGALLGRGDDGAPVMDARRCISYLTIEHRGEIPMELRPAMGNRVFGCDICQEVCPFTLKFAEPSSESAYAPRGPGEPPADVQPDAGSSPPPGAAPSHPGTAAPPLVELMATALDERRWNEFSRGSAIRRAGRAGFARNVAVALGNWGSPVALPILRAALSDPEPLVRGHAAWALGRCRTSEAEALLGTTLEAEGSPYVRSEIEAALEARER